MILSQTAIFVVTGFLAGILSGLFGVGGGIVIIPLLVFLAGFSQHQASGTSLIGLLLPVGLLGVLTYYKAGKIGAFEIKAGLILACGLFLGTFFGSKLAMYLSGETLRKAFAILVFVAGIKLWFK